MCPIINEDIRKFLIKDLGAFSYEPYSISRSIINNFGTENTERHFATTEKSLIMIAQSTDDSIEYFYKGKAFSEDIMLKIIKMKAFL